MMSGGALRAACFSLPLLIASTAAARGLGGVTPIHLYPAPSAATRGYFEGRSYDYGFFISPLFGYESNYKLVPPSAEVPGSALFALEAGADLRYRPSDKLRLSAELDATLRLPFSDTSLTEFLVELPVLLYHRLLPQLDLFLSNHMGAERTKTPPIFLDVDPLLTGTTLSKTIRYYALYEQLRPGLAWRPGKVATFDIGPYFRVKQVNFIENPYGGEPDYRLFDVGFDVAGKLLYRDRFSLRLKYDYAHRFFNNYPALPPSRQPALPGSLAMNRHVVGLLVRARVVGPLALFAGYSLRINRDNGGYFDYLEHMPSGGVSLDWPERLQVNAALGYLRRGYSNRTACEAEEEPVGSGNWVGADCSRAAPGEKKPLLDQMEAAFLVDVRVSVNITSWLQGLVTYELEDASTDVPDGDPLAPNHRVLVGLSFSH